MYAIFFARWAETMAHLVMGEEKEKEQKEETKEKGNKNKKKRLERLAKKEEEKGQEKKIPVEKEPSHEGPIKKVRKRKRNNRSDASKEL